MKNGNFASLVGVENKKLWKRVSTKIVLIILIALTVLAAGMTKLSNSLTEEYIKKQPAQTQTQNLDWKQLLKAQNDESTKKIADIEKNGTFAQKCSIDSMKMNISENNYRIEHDMKPETDSTKPDFWDTMNGYGMWQYIALLIIIISTALVAGEFGDNTMKSMITRPFTRNQILGAKLTTTVLYTLAATVISFIFEILMTLIFFGTKGIDSTSLLWIGGQTVAMPGFAATLLLHGLNLLSAFVFIFLGFFLAAVSRSRAMATGVSIFLLFGSGFLSLGATHFDWFKWIYFVEAPFSSFLTSASPYYGVDLVFSLVYCAIWTAALIAASFVTFKKRDIN